LPTVPTLVISGLIRNWELMPCACLAASAVIP
jgi:hypothetical protein